MLGISINSLRDILGLPKYWLFLNKANKLVEKGEYVRYGLSRHQHFRYFPYDGNTKGLLIYFHGGGWQFGSPLYFRALVRHFRPLGLDVIIASHRRLPVVNFAGIRTDLIDLFGHIAGFLEEKNKTIDNLIIGGMSSGGHLAAISVLDSSILSASKLSHHRLSALLLCGAVLDLDQMPNSPVVRLLAGKKSGKIWQQANPSNFIGQIKLPPTYLMHGTRDGLVPLEVVESFLSQLSKEDRNQIQLRIIKSGGHLASGEWIFKKDQYCQDLISFTKKHIH